MQQIVEVKAEDFGITAEKAKEIELGFSPSIERLNELKPEYDVVLKKEISPEVCAEAKALRLRFVKVRTDTEKIHKALKAFYLAGGRFVDTWKNKQQEISVQVEARLKDVEEHYERIELDKKEKRKNERMARLAKIEHTGEGFDLLNMENVLWDRVIIGLEKEYSDRKEVERKAEEERIAQANAAAEEQARIKAENEKLRKEAEEKERLAAIERRKHEEELAKQKAEADAERKKQEEKLRKEREAAAKERREAEAKAKAEQEKIRKEAEAKEEVAREEKARLEVLLKDQVTCPHCYKKFQLSEVKK